MGSYDKRKSTLSGFSKICDALGLSNFKSFDLLVFTYNVGKSFSLCFVDGRNVEVVFDNAVIRARKFKFFFFGCSSCMLRIYFVLKCGLVVCRAPPIFTLLSL